MVSEKDYSNQEEITWCLGCGNYSIRVALQKVLVELELKPHQVAVVSGIGQAAKMPHYLRVNGLNGLHGRALPAGTALAAVRRDLQVIVESGDGDIYGEGGNHFLHALRRNPNLALFVHNNQVYGLTKGQASPTSELGMKTPVQTKGVQLLPLNPLALAIVGGAGFVARSFAGHLDHLQEMMKRAIEYPGLAFLDILQPCVSFNRVNTFQWYRDRVYELGLEHDKKDRQEALKKAEEWGDRIPLGLLYQEKRPVFSADFPHLTREEIWDPRDRVKSWAEILGKFK